MTGHPPPVEDLPNGDLIVIVNRARDRGQNMLSWSNREKEAMQELIRRHGRLGTEGRLLCG